MEGEAWGWWGGLGQAHGALSSWQHKTGPRRSPKKEAFQRRSHPLEGVCPIFQRGFGLFPRVVRRGNLPVSSRPLSHRSATASQQFRNEDSGRRVFQH